MRKRLIVLLSFVGLALSVAGCCSAQQLLNNAQAVPTAAPSTATPIVRIVTATPSPLTSTQLGEVDAARAEEALLVQIYEQVSPAVVHITSRVIEMSFFFGPMPTEGTGSGFIIDHDGHILTNHHVIEGAESVDVTLVDGTVKPATIIGTDPLNDLALLQIDVSDVQVQPVELGQSAGLKVGQRAIAIGNPFGLDRTLTVGVVSSVGRPLELEDGTVIFDVIQTDAAINPGNSGGPLLDSYGRVIGINTAIRSEAENIGFAVPVDSVQRVLPDLLAHGRYRHPWTGFVGYSITPGLAEALQLPVDKGILVARVSQGSPAAKAGVRGATRQVRIGNSRVLIGGDIVTAVDGRPVADNQDLDRYLELETQVGQTIQLTILRNGEERTLLLELAERP